jgi:hypothetical protein
MVSNLIFHSLMIGESFNLDHYLRLFVLYQYCPKNFHIHGNFLFLIRRLKIIIRILEILIVNDKMQ